MQTPNANKDSRESPKKVNALEVAINSRKYLDNKGARLGL